MKNDILDSTKASLILATAYERDFTIEIFNVLSGVAFAFSIFTLCLLIRNNFSNTSRYRPNINIVEQMEL